MRLNIIHGSVLHSAGPFDSQPRRHSNHVEAMANLAMPLAFKDPFFVRQSPYKDLEFLTRDGVEFHHDFSKALKRAKIPLVLTSVSPCGFMMHYSHYKFGFDLYPNEWSCLSGFVYEIARKKPQFSELLELPNRRAPTLPPELLGARAAPSR